MVTKPGPRRGARPSWSRFVRTQGLRGSGLGSLLVGVVYAAFLIAALWIGVALLLPQYLLLVRALVVPLLAAGSVVLLCLSVRSMHRGVLLQSWAWDRGMQYVHQRRSKSRSPWSGTLFPRSGGYFVRHYLAGGDFETARFRSLPDGSGYHTAGIVDSFTFVRFDLPTSVPHLIVTSNRSSAFSAAGVAISGGRKLAASIEFDSSFTLHCPADYERDALYVFTPDLLALLIDAAPDCDLELLGSTAYLYISREPQLWNEGVAEKFVTAIDTLRDKLDRQTRRYKDRRIAEDAFENTSPQGLPSVALGGLRLANTQSMRGRAIAVAVWIPGIAVAAAFLAQALGWTPFPG
jgi:hypothetical protein